MVLVNLVVQVVSGGSPGHAHTSDDVAALQFRALLYQDGGKMTEAGLVSVQVVHVEVQAVPGVHAGPGHDAAGR